MRQIVGAGLLMLGLSTAAAEGTAPCVTATDSQLASAALTIQGGEAIERGDYEDARAALSDATLADRANPLAWYQLGAAYAAQARYADAADAYEHAVAIVGDDPMYRFEHGRALYKAVIAARGDTGADPYTLLFTGDELAPALAELEQALALEPRLFRAAYYVGRIRRNQREWAAAAEAFTRAIELGPQEPDPYLALGELYRRWTYLDEAIKVLAQGGAYARGSTVDEAELRYALGLAYGDKMDFAHAIDAYDQALAKAPDLAKARLARGMAHYQRGDDEEARLDFEAYEKVAPDDLTRELAHKRLLDLAARKP